MQITRKILTDLGACYVDDDATPTQTDLVSKLPATLAEIVDCTDVPLSDVVWLVEHVAPDVARRWAVWCAGRALRYAGPWHDQIRDSLRLIRTDPRAAARAADAAADAAAARAARTAEAAEAEAVAAARTAPVAAYAAAYAARAAAYAAAYEARVAVAAAYEARVAAAYAAAWARAAESARQRARLAQLVRRAGL